MNNKYLRLCVGVVIFPGLIALFLIAAPAQAASWIPLDGIQAQPEAPSIDIVGSDFNSIQLMIELSGFFFEEVITSGGDFSRIDLTGEGYTTQIGHPQLPVIRRFVEIPYGAQINLEVMGTTQIEGALADFQITHEILPLQPYAAKRPGAMEKTRFEQDNDAYARTGWSESEVARIAGEGILRGHRFITLEICPIAYSPADGRLLIRREIDLKLTLMGSDVAKTQAAKSRWADPFTNRIASRLFLNWPLPGELDLIQPPLGLLIITPPQYASLPILNNFVAWKEQKGYHTTLATTQQTGSTTAQIKAFIQNAYDTWPIPPNFVLLIGDADVIPNWVGQAPDNPGTDLYYSTLEGSDCFPDVGLGRWSVSNSAELTNIIVKSLNYEQVLWSGDNWEKAADFMASEDNWWITERTGDFVIHHYLEPDGYRSTRLYCHSFGATPPQLAASINAGRSLLAYAGHGYFFCWLDGPLFTTRDVAVLTNTYYPFVGSFACDTGQFMRASHECFGETWIRSPHGAIAYMGASATTYWIPDDILERSFFEGFCSEQSPQEDENLTWVSGMMNYAKFSFWRQSGGGDAGRYYWEVYNILGDPSVDIWTDVPQNLTVSFPSTIRIGQPNLQVNVSGYPDWAMVNVYSDAEELQVTSYVTNGVVNFNLGSGFTVPGTMHVWVTGHDCRPYHGTAAIIGAGGLSVRTPSEGLGAGGTRSVASGSQVGAQPYAPTLHAPIPNPFNPTTAISFQLSADSHVSLRVYDTAGRLVTTLVDGWREEGSHEVTFDGSGLPSGIYLANLRVGDYTQVQKMVLMK